MPAGDHIDEKKRMFGDISRLIRITIEGTVYEVPEGLELLRCYQYLDFHIAFENFCWNATCETCAANVSREGKPFERVLCCQTIAEEGLVVEKLPAGVEKRENSSFG
ncbi:MAG TPA: hypothetical protein VI895_12240 [Bdellovibrionota bacterium]|nr:hypothetical protein [Bdellovibrionota bacterium]